MKTLILLALLLISVPAWAGVSLKMKIVTQHDIAIEAGNVVNKTFSTHSVEDVIRAAELENYSWAETQIPQIYQQLLKAVMGSSSPVDLNDLDRVMGVILDKATRRQDFRREAQELKEVADEILRAAKASQEALSPDRIAELKRKTEEAADNVYKSIKLPPPGASVFCSSTIVGEK